ncbi:MAG: hypothetical protein E7Y34_01835, partial [Mycoplasma sp.]|nr:hypothetical protein [Mycoplasma sp.]
MNFSLATTTVLLDFWWILFLLVLLDMASNSKPPDRGKIPWHATFSDYDSDNDSTYSNYSRKSTTSKEMPVIASDDPALQSILISTTKSKPQRKEKKTAGSPKKIADNTKKFKPSASNFEAVVNKHRKVFPNLTEAISQEYFNTQLPTNPKDLSLKLENEIDDKLNCFESMKTLTSPPAIEMRSKLQEEIQQKQFILASIQNTPKLANSKTDDKTINQKDWQTPKKTAKISESIPLAAIPQNNRFETLNE